MHQWLDNVGFIGTENIVGSNRCRERFSDFETRKLFLFRKPLYLHPCLPAKVPSVLPAGSPPTISSYTSRLSASTIDSPRRVGRLQRPRRRAQSTFNAHDRGNGHRSLIPAKPWRRERSRSLFGSGKGPNSLFLCKALLPLSQVPTTFVVSHNVHELIPISKRHPEIIWI